jgi:hypothetical protein
VPVPFTPPTEQEIRTAVDTIARANLTQNNSPEQWDEHWKVFRALVESRMARYRAANAAPDGAE